MAHGNAPPLKNMPYIDANVILRYLLEDHAELSPRAKTLIDENTVETPTEVICEVVFVLTKVYNLKREEIAASLIDFYNNTNCILSHRETILKGIEYFGKRNLDFVDCLLAAYCEIEHVAIHTFDDKLNNLLAVIRAGESRAALDSAIESRNDEGNPLPPKPGL
jgi:predicted nucleic-acid-binding protein